MIDYQPLYRRLTAAGASRWVERLPGQLRSAFDLSAHGDLPRWLQTLAQLPDTIPSRRDLDCGRVTVGTPEDLPPPSREQLQTLLKSLHPWRKGPYELFGIHIDSEWRSDWKWRRLQAHIAPLRNRLVLDVGANNGYYGWRMLGAGAETVVGIDPTLLSVMQFHAVRKLHGPVPLYVLPLGIEDVPGGLRAFDTVFSMGVLHHRRSPLDHLLELRDCLVPHGELVLETLVIDGKPGEVLVPEDRYAKMRNVWFIPSCASLLSWLKRCGFKNVRLVDVSQTTVEEQRSTDWMQFQSLQDFFDPNNPQLTVEGLPAPTRALVIAEAP
ncbi:MAG: tRNA 5-methoxyuridine(34)/uridine 5-oxyacetic acid(34) synthase CmoB [Gammaproteobacteria bacterium]